MNPLKRWLVKALQNMVHSGRPLLSNDLMPNTDFNYKEKVGDGSKSSVAMAPVQWVCRTFPESPLQLVKIEKDKSETPVEQHPFLERLDAPNPFYDDMTLWTATLVDWNLQGNAYWLLVRNSMRGIAEIWWAPSWTIEPKYPQSGNVFISHYQYSPGGGHVSVPLDVEDVIHFRQGIDPYNVRKGLSPLGAAIREIFTDDEASNFTAAALKNMGIVGIVVSPSDKDTELGVVGDDAKATKAYIESRFTGDNRGRAIVMTSPTKVDSVAMPMKQLELGNIRNIPEERVCALLGIPAAVVGFGTGLEQTKVGATMREMIRLAWSGNIIPTQRIVAKQLENKLLPEFEPNPDQYKVQFDRSDVEALQESQNEKVERVTKMVGAGMVMVADGQEMMGLEPDPTQYVYLRGMNLVEVQGGSKGRKAGRKEVTDPTIEMYEQNRPPEMEPTRAQLRLLENMDIIREEITGKFERALKKIFTDLGKEAERAAEAILGKGRIEKVTVKGPAPPGAKWEPIDIEAESLWAEMDILAFQTMLHQKGSSHFLMVGTATFEQIGIAIGLTIGMPDPVQAKIMAEGGRRLGLIDLNKQTKKALFEALRVSRELQESVPQTVRRIRGMVSAGPWKDAETRAKVIARTEIRHAQRMSTLLAAQEAGVEKVLVLDDRIGHGGASGCDCPEWDGRVIPIGDAEAVMNAEHPNGTRDLVPVWA